ncbi:MAG: globin [Chloroflexota bacterium]
MNTQSVYEMVGGDPTFQKLVDIFYARVAQDTVLRPLFPDDLEPGKRWQFLFLTQFFGGPARYQQERGHPRLRLRHDPFPIDQLARNHWLEHMLAAIDELGIVDPARAEMREYFERGSTFMINAESAANNLMHWQSPKDGGS